MDKQTETKIAIIGAGPAGLATTKRVTEPCHNFTCSTFELSNRVGGTWVYTNKTGYDEYGMPIHSSMYQNLRTNLPKEVMMLPEFQYGRIQNRSYLTSEEVVQYFEDYADHFNLRKFIKFRHFVKNVKPMPDGKWKIKVIDLKNQMEKIYDFDAVFVCVGKFSSPIIPTIPNIENFRGLQLHSHDYKEPSKFKDQTVVIIGGKSSALDISFHVCTTAKRVYLSHHNDKIRTIPFPSNLTQKPDVQGIQNNNVVFVDGSKVIADTILYCTGYSYKYPFLDPECKITVKNMVIKPLYKHLINIEHPTMCIVGVPRFCPGLALFDLQISCFLNILEGKVALPNKAQMYAELEQDIKDRLKITGDEKNYHMLDKHAVGYCASLTKFGKVPPVKPVVLDICFNGVQRAQEDILNYRNVVYEMIDDQKYVIRELNQ